MNDVEPHDERQPLGSGLGNIAVDELTGLIGAAALMRPTGISDMEAKSVMKKFKDKKFAAGCSREVISKGAEMLGIELKELMEKTIVAMRENPVE